MWRCRGAFVAVFVALAPSACSVGGARFCFGDGLCVEPDGQKVLEDGQPICELTNTCGDTRGGGGVGDTNVGDAVAGDTATGSAILLCHCTGADAIANDSDEDCIPDSVEDPGGNGPDAADLTIAGDSNCFDPGNTPCVTGDTCGETDPNNPDTDGDGIWDGCEDKNRNGTWNPGETVAFHPDTDCDGISDGLEDANQNGIIEPLTESNPLNPDSNGDGICDGPAKPLSVPATTCTGCADCNGNGIYDPWFDGNGDGCFSATDASGNPTGDLPGELDPHVIDTDGDSIPDRVEDANANGICDAGETCAWHPDTDCDGLADGAEDVNRNGILNSTETNPLDPDSDKDGIIDGIEDANGNGRWDGDETDPRLPDTDHDGIRDGIEDSNQNGVWDAWDDLDGNGCWDDGEPGGELDPRLADTDGDGIVDSLEDVDRDGYCGVALLPDLLDPTNIVRTFLESCGFVADTDCDGLEDGLEDGNQDGKFQIGELDPRRQDTDLDGLSDGCPAGADPLTCEDQNNNDQVDPGETDPRQVDTDGDDLTDGCERLFLNGPTNPLDEDTDGDGVADGEEDGNHNCQFEPLVDNCPPPATCLETDPRVVDAGPDRGTLARSEWNVCATNNLKGITFAESSRPTHDYRLAFELEKRVTATPCGSSADCTGLGEVCDNQRCSVLAAYDNLLVKPFGRDTNSNGFNPFDANDELFGHVFQSPLGVVQDPAAPNNLASREVYGFLQVREEPGTLDALMDKVFFDLQATAADPASDLTQVERSGNLTSRPAHDTLPSVQHPRAGVYNINFAQSIFKITTTRLLSSLTVRNSLLRDPTFVGSVATDPSDVPPTTDPVHGPINCLNLADRPLCNTEFTAYLTVVKRENQPGVSGQTGVAVAVLALTPDDRCVTGDVRVACATPAGAADMARLYNDRVARLEDLTGGSALARFEAQTGKLCEVRSQQMAVADLLWIVDDSASMQQTIKSLQQASRDAQAILTANSRIVDFRVAMTTTNASSVLRSQCASGTCTSACSDTNRNCCDDGYAGCYEVCPATCDADCAGVCSAACTAPCWGDPAYAAKLCSTTSAPCNVDGDCGGGTCDANSLDGAVTADASVVDGVATGSVALPGGGGTYYYEDTNTLDCDGVAPGVDDCSATPGMDVFYGAGLARKRLRENAGFLRSVEGTCSNDPARRCTDDADCSGGTCTPYDCPTSSVNLLGTIAATCTPGDPNCCERVIDACLDGPTVLASQMCDLIRAMGGLPTGGGASARRYSASELGTRGARRLIQTMLPALPANYDATCGATPCPIDSSKRLRLLCKTADCPAPNGDGTCEADQGETAASCPSDCRCGDAICDASEDSTSCSGDCSATCGDGTCDPGQGESAANCHDCFSGTPCVPCDPRVDDGCAVVPLVSLFLSDEEDYWLKDECEESTGAFGTPKLGLTDRRPLPAECNWIDGDPKTFESCDACLLDKPNPCTDDADCSPTGWPPSSPWPQTCTGTTCTCDACAVASRCATNADCPGNCINGRCECTSDTDCTAPSTCVGGFCGCDRRAYCEGDGLEIAPPDGYNPDAVGRRTVGSAGFAIQQRDADAPQCLSTTVNGVVNNTQPTSCTADPCNKQTQVECQAIQIDVNGALEDYCVWDTNGAPMCRNRCAMITKALVAPDTPATHRCDCAGNDTKRGGDPSCTGTGDPICKWVRGQVNLPGSRDTREACQPYYPVNDCRACKRFVRTLDAVEGVPSDPFFDGGNEPLVGFGEVGPVYAIVRDRGEEGFGGNFFNVVEDACHGGSITWGLGDGHAYRELARETLGRTQDVCADSYADFMGLVISDIAALSAPYALTATPIASTLEVGIARPNPLSTDTKECAGVTPPVVCTSDTDCDPTGTLNIQCVGYDYIEVPRSRTQGFFYSALTNTIAFKSDPVNGVCNPPTGGTAVCDDPLNLEMSEILYAQNAPTVPRDNDTIFISYRLWKPVPCLELCTDTEICMRILCAEDSTPPSCPNGTDAECPLGYVCNLGNNECRIDCTPGELADICVTDVGCGPCQAFNTQTGACESVGDYCVCNPTGAQSCTPGVFASCPNGFACDENCGCARIPGCANGFTGAGDLAACQEDLLCCRRWDTARDLCRERTCSAGTSAGSSCTSDTQCPGGTCAGFDQAGCDGQPSAVCQLLGLSESEVCADDDSPCIGPGNCPSGAACRSPCEAQMPCEWGAGVGCDFSFPTCCDPTELAACFADPETGGASLYCRQECICEPACGPKERCEKVPGSNVCACGGTGY